PEFAVARVRERHDLDPRAARNLLEYLRDQVAAAGAVPDDKTIIVERYLDEVGDWRVCVLTPFGGKVHAPWAMAIGAMVRERSDIEIDVLWTDDGIVARFPEAERAPDPQLVLPDPERVEALVIDRLSQTPLFAARFREAAARALLLPRRYPGQRSPLWHQRRRAGELLQIASRFSSSPIILEAYRECLQDVFDMPALLEVLREIRSRDIRIVTVDSRTPSPFASALLFEYVGNFIYEGDAPLAERRAQALTVDPLQLRQLLGEAELRELLDPGALSELAVAGTVVEGEFRPGGHGAEWIDANVLRTLRQRSLARLRKEIEPVEGSALARFELAWQGVDKPRSGEAALLDAIAQLEG